MGWMEARLDCAADGGHLIKIETSAENAEVDEQLFLIDVWIGLHDKQQDEVYRWDDDTVLGAFSSWGSRNSSEECVSLNTDGARWNTMSCGQPLVAICECDGVRGQRR